MNASRRLSRSRVWLIAALCLVTLPALAGERVFTFGPFDTVDIDGPARISLIQSDTDRVVVNGSDEALDNIEVRPTKNRVRISPAGGWKFWNGDRLRIELHMREVSRITLSGASDLRAHGPLKADELAIHISGAGQVRFDDLDAKTLKLDISGSGDGQLTGQVESLNLNVSGKGKLMAYRLRANEAKVSINGVGQASLWVTETLKVNISGVGQVEYQGEPTVERSVSGMGSIVARGSKPAR